MLTFFIPYCNCENLWNLTLVISLLMLVQCCSTHSDLTHSQCSSGKANSALLHSSQLCSILFNSVLFSVLVNSVLFSILVNSVLFSILVNSSQPILYSSIYSLCTKGTQLFLEHGNGIISHWKYAGTG